MAEKVLYECDEIKLTSDELIYKGTPYDLHSISRVEILQEKMECAMILFAGAMILAFGMIYGSGLAQLLGFIVLVIAGVLLYKAYIDVFIVQVIFNNGHKIDLGVKDKDACRQLARALTRFSTIPTHYKVA